ncbi:hypothetical protein FIBSPDRAFT_333820 [Athelia psychrophila]|uniref:Uncharacterized protein n=1 Tax=Athelia psychrophila TaxID=1759441 RepID=A0A166Q4T9_9AGAM|nr:hypothetical protein FIBSPDRAFT_333820 [Fibularhizoctonia sp. CBS 109695]
MPTAPVDNNGTVLFYTDSGPVDGSDDYTTLVIYHGSAFTGHTFNKLLPLGAKDNIRLVIVNRREYAGSTPYTDENIADLNAGRAVFMVRLAAEVAHLLIWFLETHDIPKISADGKKGGFAVMGWSAGAATPLSTLAYPEVVGKEAYAKLELYYRRCILYDPSFLPLGYDRPAEGYHPYTDPDFPTPEALFNNFAVWASGYYEHPDLASRSIHGLDFSKRGACPSIENMTPEEMSKNFDGAAAARSEGRTSSRMRPTVKIMVQQALFNDKLTAEVLPDVTVDHIWCRNSVWYCLYAMIETKRQQNEHVEHGHKIRPIRFIEVSGNHFVHWDDPAVFWETIVQSINH